MFAVNSDLRAASSARFSPDRVFNILDFHLLKGFTQVPPDRYYAASLRDRRQDIAMELMPFFSMSSFAQHKSFHYCYSVVRGECNNGIHHIG